MTELREKVIDAIVATCDDQPRACLEAAADHILAIREIAEALEWVKARSDALYGGTGFVRVQRIDPANVRITPDAP